MKTVVLESTITCPACGHKNGERCTSMPVCGITSASAARRFSSREPGAVHQPEARLNPERRDEGGEPVTVIKSWRWPAAREGAL